MSDVVIRPISADQHDAVMHFFDLVAYADNPNWSRCYCMERLIPNYSSTTKEENRSARSALIRSGTANGLVAYRLGRVVGWCHAAPKPGLHGLIPGATPTTGAIVCFVVAPDQRRQGIATALLAAALDYLRDRGMTEVEAYPVAADQEGNWPQVNYMGALGMYLRAGFEVVDARGDRRLVRRRIAADERHDAEDGM